MNDETRRRTIRRTTAAVGIATAAALLSACAEELPQPVAEEAYTGPMLTVDQELAVVEDVSASLDAATGDLDPKKLEGRVTGPALQVRTRELAIAKATDDNSWITEIPTSTARMIVPTTQTWPRVSYNITEPTEDLGTNRLVAYQQATARENYKMWSWVQLIPGTTLPGFADPEVIGSGEVAPDDDSLVVTPTEALAQYADVVAKGPDGSEYADAFALPTEAQDLVARIQADAKNVREVDGFDDADAKVRLAFVPQSGLVAVRTSDGGAVVMGALDGNSRITAEDDAEIPPISPTQIALAGDDDPTNELYTEYTDQVAIYVPPAGADAPMQPIGYSHVVTDVETKIPGTLNTDRDE